MGLRDEVAGANRGERPRLARLRLVHDANREREARGTILRLLLSERPAELRACAVMARIGEPRLAGRAIEGLVEAGLVIRVDEYLLATAAAVRSDRAAA